MSEYRRDSITDSIKVD